MGRPASATVAATNAERLAEVAARSASTVIKEPGALATTAHTMIAAAPTAAAAAAAGYGVKKVAEHLAGGGAAGETSKREAERKRKAERKRRENGLPEEP